MRLSARRWTSNANSRSGEAAGGPYRPRNHGVFNLIGALGLLFGLGVAASAVAQAEDGSKYKALVKEALFEYKAGRWEEARALFEQAHERNPNARTLRGIGMASYEARQYAEAIRAFEAALRDERRPLTAQQRKQIRQWIENAYRFVAMYRVELEPPGAALQVDGNPAQLSDDGMLVLDAGRHEMVAVLDGYETVTRQAVAFGGKKGTIEISLTPLSDTTETASDGTAIPEPDAGLSEPDQSAMASSGGSDDVKAGSIYGTLGWVSVGGAALGFGGALWAWLEHESLAEQWKQDAVCSNSDTSGAPHCSDLREAHETAKTWIIVGLAVGGTLSAAAVAFFVLDAVEESDGQRAGVACTSGPGDLGIACAVGF